MLGTIIGDIVGSRFEFMATQEENFNFFHGACHFTDDTVCSAAIAAATIIIKENISLLTHLRNKYPTEYQEQLASQEEQFIAKIYIKTLKQIAKKYPLAGYGKHFFYWLESENSEPYGSLGNGSLMRMSPIILLSDSLEQAKYLAHISSAITHNHSEALQCVQYYTELLWLCKTSNHTVEETKNQIKEKLNTWGLSIQNVEHYHQQFGFYVLAPDTLERALACVLESTSYEETIRKVIYIGSDTDTTGAIAGNLAEMLYGIPLPFLNKTLNHFNFYNIELLQYVLEIYQKPRNIGSLYFNNSFDHEKQQWYKNTLHLVLEDPTAAWDPLEDVSEDEYYSDADKSLLKEQQSFFKNLLNKLINKNKK